MKKVFAFILLMFGITLTSCGGPKQDLEHPRFVTIDPAIKTNLNIEFDDSTNSNKLTPDQKDKDSYYKVYTAANAKESLFIYEVEVDHHITDRTKEIFANTLSFEQTIYPDEQTAILNELYDKDHGIGKLELGFTADTEKSYSKNRFSSYVYEASKDLDSVKLSVVYLPVYVIRIYKSEPILKEYLFLPVHITFVSGDKLIKADDKADKGYALVDKEISGIESVTPEFDPKKPQFLLKAPVAA